MPLVTTAATILKTYEYSETSKILRLLTQECGLCSVIAKGARRPKSRFGGVLEPFTDGIATYYVKPDRDLHTLSGFELRKERQALGRDLVHYAGAGLLTEIALRFAPGAPDLRLFRQLRIGLDRLVDERRDPESAVLEETWRLIGCLGFAPNLDRCAVCGTSMSQSEGQGTVAFDLAGGGLRCRRCRSTRSATTVREVPEAARIELSALVRGRRRPGEGRLQTARLQRALLRDFIIYHVADGRPLNSFRFLEARLSDMRSG